MVQTQEGRAGAPHVRAAGEPEGADGAAGGADEAAEGTPSQGSWASLVLLVLVLVLLCIEMHNLGITFPLFFFRPTLCN